MFRGGGETSLKSSAFACLDGYPWETLAQEQTSFFSVTACAFYTSAAPPSQPREGPYIEEKPTPGRALSRTNRRRIRPIYAQLPKTAIDIVTFATEGPGGLGTHPANRGGLALVCP